MPDAVSFNEREVEFVKEGLTPKEREIYEYVRSNICRAGYSPSVRDIQTALSIKSTSTVHAYLDRLEVKGYIVRSPGKSRTIRTSGIDQQLPGESIKIPLVGQVAAGYPILAVENIEGHIDFPLNGARYSASELYALRVRGESMINAGISDGDIIVVKKQQNAENGEIVVALIDDEATVKRFYRENGYIRLQPENPSMEPIIIKDRPLLVLGRVIGAIKYF